MEQISDYSALKLHAQKAQFCRTSNKLQYKSCPSAICNLLVERIYNNDNSITEHTCS